MWIGSEPIGSFLFFVLRRLPVPCLPLPVTRSLVSRYNINFSITYKYKISSYKIGCLLQIVSHKDSDLL